MADFKPFSEIVHSTYTTMAKGELFRVALTGDELWAAYLAAFPEGTNPIFRQRTEHDCSCCRNFIKNLGPLVSLDDNGGRITVWDEAAMFAEQPYAEVAEALSRLVQQAPIEALYRTKERSYGAELTFEEVEGQGPINWNHLHGRVADKHYAKEPQQAIGEYAGHVQVFRRGLTDLSPEAVETVLGLIADNNLYRGTEHKPALQKFQKLQGTYIGLRYEGFPIEPFVWLNADKPGARIRNTAIGTLLIDLSEGVELERAVASFENKVSGTNYKRPKALVTPRMVEDAMKAINDLGLESALHRRFANMGDITINNVLWADNGAKHDMKGSLTSQLVAAATKAAVKVDLKNAIECPIDTFIRNILPAAATVDLLFKNDHEPQLLSLTTAIDPDAGLLFKWPNSFAWSYNGGVTDSIKQRVKAAGGNVDAALRFSLAWHNADDLDLHVWTPKGEHVYFIHRRCTTERTQCLDLDMNGSDRHDGEAPVENCVFQSPQDGVYKVVVHQYNVRKMDRKGFTLEIQNGMNVEQYSCPTSPGQGEQFVAGEFTVKGGVIVQQKLNPALTGGSTPKELWGINTEQFRRVEAVMYSPNHWDGHAVGNKHYIFTLAGLVNPEQERGMYPEFLKAELEPKRKAFELIGSTLKTPHAANQLSGIGFSETVRSTAIFKIDGARVYKVHF